MNPTYRHLAKLLIVLAAASVAVPLCAQDVEPAATAKPAAKAAAAKPAAKAEPAPENPPAVETKKPGAKEPLPDNAAVQAILANNPRTPFQWTQAAKILAELGRPDLSKQFLQRVLAAKLDDQALADLVAQIGSEALTGMADRTELLPEARQLTDAALAAANRRLRDPQQIAQRIRQLQDPAADVRYRAMNDLLEAHGAAVGPLMEVLVDPARSAEKANVRAVLVRLGADAVNALLGMLEKADRRTTAQAIEVLSAMDAVKAAPYLLRPALSPQSDAEVRSAAVAALERLIGQVPGKAEAVQALVQRAQNYFDQRQPVAAEAAGQVELWDWDAAGRRCVAKGYAPDDAQRFLAARLARDAFALAPQDRLVRRLYLATMWEQAAYQRGLDHTIADQDASLRRVADTLGVTTLEDVLQYAISSDHAAAATVAAQLLGRSGRTAEVLYRGDRPAPLVLAAQHSDRRLRLAAAEAIVRLKPDRPFAGSSYVTGALAFLAGSRGTRRVLVGSPTSREARNLAGMMAAGKLEVDSAATGRELLRMAAASPDYELALIDVNIDQPTVDFVLQQLRGDYRSADLRVGLIARADRFAQAEHVARDNSLTLAFPRPHDEQSLQWQLAQLAALGAREFVGHAERQRQAGIALELLAELSRLPGGIYDLRQIQDALLAALYTPALSAKVVDVLANLGTPESQRALVDLANRSQEPFELRKAAVEAFRVNSAKYGLLLTTAEIRQQYDRYNRSQSSDASSQGLLGLLLDLIEAPSQTGKVK